MSHQAILDENFNIIPVEDVLEWAKAFEKCDRRLWHTEIRGYRISTVFLGLDYGFNGPPLWFETMIFPPGSWQDIWMQRTGDLANAYGSHKRGEAWLQAHFRTLPILFVDASRKVSDNTGSP